jgi:hypothetical protein
MLMKSACRLLQKYGQVTAAGEDWFVTLIDGHVIEVVAAHGGRKVDVATARRVCADGVEDVYHGGSVRDALRATLQRHRRVEAQVADLNCVLAVDITHGAPNLAPMLHFMLNSVVVSTLQGAEAFGMALPFLDGGDWRPLLDWLQEQSPTVAHEMAEVYRQSEAMTFSAQAGGTDHPTTGA